MGAVYRARDTQLGRDVALKVLPDSFSNDPDRVARFTREAQVLASLDHPNIARIYGLERVGTNQIIVMEMVEGATLEARLAHGRLRSTKRDRSESRLPTHCSHVLAGASFHRSPARSRLLRQ
jgi:serine/threonine protein kinase